MKKILLFISLFLGINLITYAQSDPLLRFIIVIADSNGISDITQNNGYFNPVFFNTGANDIVSKYKITKFERAYEASRFPIMKRVWLVEYLKDPDLPDLMNQLLSYNKNLFSYGEMLEPVQLLHQPNDYGLVFQGQHPELDFINAPAAWDISTGDPNVIIGITDTYFDVGHPDLPASKFSNVRTNIIPSFDIYHGTAVAGFAAGSTNNNVGLSNIGYNCRLDVSSRYQFENELLFMSRDGIKILNGSWLNGCSPTLLRRFFSQNMYNEIYENGTSACFGAGNGGAPCINASTFVYPASLDHNISVTTVGHLYPRGSAGGSNWKDMHLKSINHTSSHNHNSQVDIAAPGYQVGGLTWRGISGTDPAYTAPDTYTGTSFSSPMVAGTLGLMRSVKPALSPYQLEYILKVGAENIYWIPENQPFIGQLGAGRLNAYNSVWMANGFDPNDPATQTMYITEIGISNICKPNSSNSPNPKLVPTIVNGTAPFTYLWEEWPGINTAILDNINIETPEVISATNLNANYVYYRLTAFDSSPIQKVASRVFKANIRSNIGHELVIRDSGVDAGNQPNDQETVDPRNWSVWQSPDIWNRHTPDGQLTHQNPEYFNNAPNYLYVRVKNTGCSSSSANNQLHLYWTLTATGERWPDAWIGSVLHNSLPGGAEITKSPIILPSLNSGDENIIMYEWYPPKPQDFDKALTQIDLCVLARIEEPNAPNLGMFALEVPNVKTNIVNNNNIATRNFIVTNLNPNNRTSTHLTFIENMEDFEQTFDLQIINERAIELHYAGDFSRIGLVKLYLDETVFDRWISNGSNGKYQYVNYTDKYIQFNGFEEMILNDINLYGGDRFPAKIVFELKEGSDGSPINHLFHFRQIHNTDEGSVVYGNVSYQIQPYVPEEGFVSSPNSQPLERKYLIYPNPANNIVRIKNITKKENAVTISFYDLTGRLAGQRIKTTLDSGEFYEKEIGELKPGVYWISIEDGKEHSMKYKFVKI